MAMVFPKNNKIDNLLSATKFADSQRAIDPQQAIDPQRLQEMLDAVEGLRQKVLAKTHPELLWPRFRNGTVIVSSRTGEFRPPGIEDR